jgi:hypothetical protein
MKLFCNHKYGPIKDEIQYCTKCGKAHRIKHVHKWVTFKEYGIRLRWDKPGNDHTNVYEQRCSICGDLRVIKNKLIGD